MADLDLRTGQLVRINDGRQGTIQYVGKLHFTDGIWVGLELPDASGYGIFARQQAVVEVVKQPAIKSASKTNGKPIAPSTNARPRPSSGLSTDAARKRQSIVSSGSASASASRLSMRSPTKSPVKPTSTSVSSATSTPRTSTPSTTTRPTQPDTRSRLSTTARPSLGSSRTTARNPVPSSRPSIGGASTLRQTTTNRTTNSSTKPSVNGKTSLQAGRTALELSKPVQTDSSITRRQGDTIGDFHSPTIDEEVDEVGEDNDVDEPNTEEAPRQPEEKAPQQDEHEDEEPKPLAHGPASTRVVSGSRTGAAGNVESRIAQQREIEQLKAKIRTLEKRRQEDRDKIKQVDVLQSDKDRFEGIIQALQKKIRANQQELVETRKKCEDAEARAKAVPDRSGELESEIELATLDKEMAEERAETYRMELEALAAKHEELELEVDILREENAELASTMDPEEKASAGWLQMEREKDRLRDALIRLRDMSQDSESSMKAEIDELRANLDEAEKTAGMYTETAEKLIRAEQTNMHLMGQLEAVESNDEVVEALESQREQNVRSIEELKQQVQDLDEHIQVTDELELFHVEEEKRLHIQLDESEAMLSESHRRSLEQDRTIEDLEYTLTKFRDVVQGLQNDIDELRRSREISEMQASEMSSKSRAMMDLNLRLQNSAAKTQAKTIETELSNIKAELTRNHLDILTLFTPDTFDQERKPITALLSFNRIGSKARLVGRMLGERLRERSHLNSGEEIFRSFETVEYMGWISRACLRFEKYMNGCGTQEFAACSVALTELEPVERTVTNWIEALRNDELASSDPEHLKRMQGVLTDLSEKLIIENTETKSTELATQMGMVESYAESVTGQLTAILKLVQSKLGPAVAEDEESLVFDKKMDQMATRSRTIKYLSGKIMQKALELRESSLCLSESNWVIFEKAEQAAEVLTKQIRLIGFAIAEKVSNDDADDPLSYASISSIIGMALHNSPDSNINNSEEPFSFLLQRLISLQTLIDDIQNKASDLNNTIEFESRPAPWIVRAKDMKAAKLIPPETQEELLRLERRNVELGNRIAEREKTIEEMGMRVEIAEKRFKESREKDNKEKALQDEIHRLKTERENNEKSISDLRNELTAAQKNAETVQVEIETLRQTASSEVLGTTATTTTTGIPIGHINESVLKQFELEAHLLRAEITSLQAATRYLREENRNLRIPISEVLIHTARNSWLDGSISRKHRSAESTRRENLEREGVDIWTGLIDVANTVKPLRLSAAKANSATVTAKNETKSSSWQPVVQTTRYAVLKQREELEKWEALREDFIKRAKIVSTGVRAARGQGNGMKANRLRTGRGELGGAGLDVGVDKKIDVGARAGEVEILEI